MKVTLKAERKAEGPGNSKAPDVELTQNMQGASLQDMLLLYEYFLKACGYGIEFEQLNKTGTNSDGLNLSTKEEIKDLDKDLDTCQGRDYQDVGTGVTGCSHDPKNGSHE